LEFFIDKVIYINNKTKVIITCPIHGDFEQKPNNHLNGKGCQKCGGTTLSNTQDFIKNSILKHGDRFTYYKVNYINNKTKVIITCPTHGDFKQDPNSHLLGFGCQKCNKSKGEIIIEKILKEKKINFQPQFKFKDLKHKGLLRFDFGILDINGVLKYLIEYNGEQHYKFKKPFYKNKEEFKISQYRDKLKKEYCLINNIPLYIIKYNEKNIENKIIKIINIY
jgi:hypothetical protein